MLIATSRHWCGSNDDDNDDDGGGGGGKQSRCHIAKKIKDEHFFLLKKNEIHSMNTHARTARRKLIINLHFLSVADYFWVLFPLLSSRCSSLTCSVSPELLFK